MDGYGHKLLDAVVKRHDGHLLIIDYVLEGLTHYPIITNRSLTLASLKATMIKSEVLECLSRFPT